MNISEGQIFGSEKYVVTWEGCELQATLSVRTFDDLHDASCYATRRVHCAGITIESVKQSFEIRRIPKAEWIILEEK